VRNRQDLPAALRQLIGAQHGLVTAQQAATYGVGDDALCRLVDQGHWQRSTRGLYDTVPLMDSFQKRAWAALLVGGPEAAIGGEAALCLHGLDREVQVIDVWVPPDAQPQPLTGIRVRRDFLNRLSRRRGHIPRITVEEALIDVGQLLPTSRLVALLTDAFRQRVTTPLAVAAALESRRRVRGRHLFESLLGDMLGVESGLEYVYRRDVERAHGLPTARRQVSLSSGTRSDAVYEEQGVIVELDGLASHAAAIGAFRDLRRDNAHAELNLITLRYGSADVRGRPCDVAAQVAAVLRSRGWTGQRTACPRCRRQAVS
jgi:very-short-patch-repair endonuclease